VPKATDRLLGRILRTMEHDAASCFVAPLAIAFPQSRIRSKNDNLGINMSRYEAKDQANE
jgi:hypothetical protein